MLTNANIANAQLSCSDFFYTEIDSTSFFLDLNSNFHQTDFVTRPNRAPEHKNSGPEDRVERFVAYINKLSDRARRSPQAVHLIKSIFYNQFVIKPEQVPDSYFDLQIRIARERGHGDITLSDQERNDLINVLIEDQKASLDTWIDYFVSSDTDMYPSWVKFWALTSVGKLGKYNPEQGKFSRRRNNTTAPFVELDREAFGYTVDALLKSLRGESLSDLNDPDLAVLAQQRGFGKIYAHNLFKAGFGKAKEFKSNEGQWVNYKKGADHTPLVTSLSGKGTGWCTAADSTAKEQLARGDFHVYYSNDEDGFPTVPRIAVRMQEQRIAEVRGVGDSQHLDPMIASTNIVARKMKEFGPEGERFNQADADMKKLTAIDKKIQDGITLSVEELRFLYEVDRPIQGFGYAKDPRIGKILGAKKNDEKKADIILILGLDLSVKEMALHQRDGIRSAKVYYGSWIIPSARSNFYGIHTFFGDITFQASGQKKSIKFPSIVRGKVQNEFQSRQRHGYVFEDIQFPREVESLELFQVESMKDIIFPEIVDSLVVLGHRDSGNLYMGPSNWTMPKQARYIRLSVEHAEGLEFPVEAEIDFYRLRTYKGLALPEGFAGRVILPLLENMSDLVIPPNFRGILEFQNGLPDMEDLNLPSDFSGEVIRGEYVDPMPGEFAGWG